MSTLAFFSAKGAPGTTTAAMLVASLWPRPVLLVDADPAGGDIALRLPAPDGRPLDQSRGLLSLLPLARRDIAPEQVLTHAQQVLGGGELIAGVAGPEQASAAGPVWAALADVLARLPDHDVVVDLGRFAALSPVLQMAARADIAVMVVGDTVSGVYAGRARLRALEPILTGPDGGGPQLGVIVLSNRDRDAESAASVIHAEFGSVSYFGRLALDPDGARMFDGQAVARPERTMIVRSGRTLVGRLDSALGGREPAAPAQPEAADAAEPDATPAPEPAVTPAVGPAAEPAVERADPASARAGRGRTRSEERAAQRGRSGRRRAERPAGSRDEQEARR